MVAGHVSVGPDRHAPPFLPPVIGHRGAAGRAPENTLAGFRRAKELGCSWIEFDARLTADGTLVVCHDARLDRTTPGSGIISALRLVAVRNADAGMRFDPQFRGERIPTLDETMALAVQLGLAIDIEIKADHGRDYATAAAVADALHISGRALPTLIVSSFSQAALAAIRVLAPEIPRAVLFGLVPRGWQRIASRLGAVAIGADHRRLSRRRVAAIRAAGYPLAAFTVNNPARARLLYGWGVTSVFSDLPDIILKAATGRAPAGSALMAPHISAPARQGTT